MIYTPQMTKVIPWSTTLVWSYIEKFRKSITNQSMTDSLIMMVLEQPLAKLVGLQNIVGDIY